jgi:hypothetical protein
MFWRDMVGKGGVGGTEGQRRKAVWDRGIRRRIYSELQIH